MKELRWSTPAADPGFTRRGCQPLNLRKNLLFCWIFAKNCMKMKETGPRDELTPLVTPLDLPMYT